jgi:nucleoside-diphosphate kinase
MKKEKTFVAIKHDGVQRSLIGNIIGRFENAGLKIVAMKMLIPSKELAQKHYGKDDAWYEKAGNRLVKELEEKGKKPKKEALEYGKEIIQNVIDYITAGPVVAMIIEGPHSVAIVKKLVGGTDPINSDVGTIRGDFTIDSYPLANADNRSIRNLIHCTDVDDDPQKEIDLWFTKEEIMDYKHVNDVLFYDETVEACLKAVK